MPLRLGTTIALLLTAALLASSTTAEAQRRGRRGRGRGPTAAQTAPPPNPFGADPASPTDPAAPEAAPAAPPAPPAPATPAPATPAATPPAAPQAARVTPSTPAPVATSTPAPAADPGPTPPDLGPLRQEYVAIMDEMVEARSRVAVLGEELFHTRMSITVQDRTGGAATLARFALELDGTPVHRTDGPIEGAAAGRQLWEGALAPGPHVLTLDLEQRARDDPEYRVSQRESFRFIVVRDRLTEVTIVLENDSDIARSFRTGGEGRFEIRTRLRVAMRELPRS